MKRFNGKQLLVFIYLAIIAVSIFRISVHPLRYTTPDSIAYLEHADFIKSSWNSSESLTGFFEIKGAFTTWPIGYPVCIAATSFLTGTSSLVASKIVNFVFLGFIFLLLFKIFDDKAWFVSLAFFSYGFLEVIAETWSELPFVFFVLLLCYFVLKERDFIPWKLSLLLIVCLVSLFMFRYVGVIYFFLLALYLIQHGLAKNYRLITVYLIALLVSSTFVLWYFHENKAISGYYSGMPRLETAHKSLGSFALELLQGLLNEFFIARNYFFKGWPDLLFVVLAVAQIGGLFLLSKGRNLVPTPINISKEVKGLLRISAAYVIGITLFKVFIPIDAFDFRILFPFSAPLLIGVFAVLVNESYDAFFKRYAQWITGFMLLSLLINLPKKFILESLGLF